MDAKQRDLVFESFLKKRKDKMKFTWATYWFRLQNATLFFYTKKHGNMSSLRGQYYIHTFQSVREKKATDDEYPFEITMKNGKRKLLSAASSELRAVWIEFLWKAMQLPGPGRKQTACTWHDIPDLMQKAGVSANTDDSEEDAGETFSSASGTSGTKGLFPSEDFRKPEHLDASLDCSYTDSQRTMRRNSSSTSSSGIEDDDISYEIIPSLDEEDDNNSSSNDEKQSNSGIYSVPRALDVIDNRNTADNSSNSPGLLEEITSNFTKITMKWMNSSTKT
ncbi:uncharacterized protein LOC102357877 isoform X2 [Latimeria chalumnae]|uniref:uncharacterized protein LOC102357877 isoform X2 n=1 Tax=Latimeria chalumnae TaxID=7897 RepID=UPI0003C1B29E|nr:PREDICTED: uncharacterized protein LOC102357877 isoform X2 [Latimeria chalumnae]|eukprot:XP_005993809.1 PREDICTED: uncharacterized protein LOC102357877 isoform X2 [Latimeria chalumnae]